MTGGISAKGRLAEAPRVRIAEPHDIGDCAGRGLIRKSHENAARVACGLECSDPVRDQGERR
jgi:hypothetical protein